MFFKGKQNATDVTGYASADADHRVVGTDMDITKISIALPANFKEGEEEEVFWANIVAFKHKAKYLSYAKKGDKIRVIGYLRTNKWEKDGVKYERTEIIAEEIFLPQKPSDGAKKPGGYNPPSNNNIMEDDIPF